MKKKILSIALAGTIALGGGVLLSGCKKEDQSKLHEIFREANVSTTEYTGSVTFSDVQDGCLYKEGTYDAYTGRYAIISYDENGEIRRFAATKIFQDGIGLFGDFEEKLVDRAYVVNEVEDDILTEITQEIELGYDDYVAEGKKEVEDFCNDIKESGGKVNKVTYKTTYKSLGKQKYQAQIVRAFDYELIENGEGYRYAMSQKETYVFNNDWIYSVKVDYSNSSWQYIKGETPKESKNEGKRDFVLSQNFDETIYSKINLEDKTIPAEAEYATLIFKFGENQSPIKNVPFNIDIKEKAEELNPLETGMAYEFYLDMEYTIPMPEGYQLNTQEINVIYAKLVLAEGYTQVVEVFQDSTGVRGSRTNIVRLGDDFEYNNVYDSKTFIGEIIVDGNSQYGTQYRFSKGESHTILYLANYNVEMVTKSEITISLNGKYYFIPEGTPSEQTLRKYLNDNDIYIEGVSAASSAFELTISTIGGTTLSADDSLSEFDGMSYTITSSIKDGYVVVRDRFSKTVAAANDTEIVFKFNKHSQTLRMNVRGSVYDYTRFRDKFGVVPLIVEDADGNMTVKIIGGFKEDTPYLIYLS